MKSIKALFLVGGLFLALGLQAQQDPQYTQYMFNGLAVNPAYAGSHKALSLTALYRKQWVNIPGAPQTISVSAHTPAFNERVGLGLQVVNDRIGINEQTNLYGSVSYFIPINNRGGRLAFGLQGGVNNFSVDNSKLNLENPEEDNFQDNFSTLKPNIGAGVYYYSDKMFVGLSSLQLIQNEFGTTTANYRQLRHLFTYFGYVFTLNENWKFKPTMLVKAVAGSPIEADISANFLFIEKLWLGVAYRSFDSFDFLIQYHFTPQLSLGYAYDYTLTKLSQYNSGSHEIMINYLFKYDNDKMITPRYF